MCERDGGDCSIVLASEGGCRGCNDSNAVGIMRNDRSFGFPQMSFNYNKTANDSSPRTVGDWLILRSLRSKMCRAPSAADGPPLRERFWDRLLTCAFYNECHTCRATSP